MKWVFITGGVFLLLIVFLMIKNNRSSESPSQIPSPTPTASKSPSEFKTPQVEQINEESLKETRLVKVALENGLSFTITVYPKIAPNTVKNYLDKFQSGYYHGLTFHRVEEWVVQGGDPTGTGNGGNKIQTELNNQPFKKGAVGVARGGDIES